MRMFYAAEGVSIATARKLIDESQWRGRSNSTGILLDAIGKGVATAREHIDRSYYSVPIVASAFPSEDKADVIRGNWRLIADLYSCRKPHYGLLACLQCPRDETQQWGRPSTTTSLLKGHGVIGMA